MTRSITALTIGTLMAASLSNGQAAELTVSGDSRIVAAGATLETLWEDGGFTEGAASGSDGCVYFSDFAQPFDSGPARVMKFDPKSNTITIHCPDSGMGNGLMFTRDGKLIGCCASPLGGHRSLVEFLPDGTVLPIVSKFEEKRFNSPNDLVIDRKGRIYFSDPKYVGPEKLELDRFNLFRLDPDGTLQIATQAVDKPNGVMLSPDQRILYVAETDNGSATADLDKEPATPRTHDTQRIRRERRRFTRSKNRPAQLRQRNRSRRNDGRHGRPHLRRGPLQQPLWHRRL